jgi:hypothetical protein
MEMEAVLTRRSLARGGSRMGELNTAGQRERERERDNYRAILTSSEGRRQGRTN